MVAPVLIIALLLAAVPAFGDGARQLCLSCHPAHYAERGGCALCHLGNPASARKNIAHAGLRGGKYVRFTVGDGAYIKEGERLMAQLACRRCHVSSGRGNPLAVNLDDAASRKTAGELALSIRRPVANMPLFDLDEERVTALVNTILAGSKNSESVGAAPVRVHFSAPGKKGADVFSTKCGNCHRLLSRRLGAVGSGDIGPNLSGLFSEYYPKTFRGGEAWNAANLHKWLKNPRDVVMWALMRHVALTEAEKAELESLLLVNPAANR